VLNQNQGPIAEAEAKRVGAAAQFTALQARVIGDIDRALTSYRAGLAKLATANALLENAQKQQRTTQAMLEAGEIARFALSTTELELSQTALARLDALVKAQQAWGELENALQSPLGLPESLWLTSPRERNNTEKKHE
jgi:cobalt-zinc-cadmium efflux system outer membrane protein